MNKPIVTEDAVEEAVTEGLAAYKYTCLVTTHRYKTRLRCFTCGDTTSARIECQTCGKPLTSGYGASKGVPDLIVTHETYPRFVFVGLELKGTNTKISDEQQVLATCGRIAIVRSFEEAMRAVALAEAQMGITGTPATAWHRE